MNQGDVMGHRSRSRGVYYTIANQMIAEPLMQGWMSFTDVVSLIEMRTTSEVNPDIFMEPFTWELHNKIVSLASMDNALSGKGHGNYIPAIQKAFELIKLKEQNNNSAVNIFFLSDGRPSDMTSMGVNPLAILTLVANVSKIFGDRLTLGTFGFAHDVGGTGLFDLLQQMAEVATAHGAKGIHSAGLDTSSLRKALTTMTTSLMSSRTSMSSLAGGTGVQSCNTSRAIRQDLHKDVVRNVIDAVRGGDFNPLEYDFYMMERDSTMRYEHKCDGMRKRDNISFVEMAGLVHPDAKGIAVKRKYIEAGAERATFHMTEVDRNMKPVGQALVAKKSLHEEPSQLEFHKRCARTQLEARRLSVNFNRTVSDRGINIPIVEFLEPWFYVWTDVSEEDGGESYHAVLAEKRLDISRYKKWNDNTGGDVTLHILAEKNPAKKKQKEVIAEKETKDDENEIEMDTGEEVSEGEECDSELDPVERLRIIDDDVPQAFSHWTYQYTHGDALVCDLQGVLSSKFYLTDPAIHSRRYRKSFGPTDYGMSGQKRFFDTHSCNPLCKCLGLRIPNFKK